MLLVVGGLLFVVGCSISKKLVNLPYSLTTNHNHKPKTPNHKLSKLKTCLILRINKLRTLPVTVHDHVNEADLLFLIIE